MALASVFFDSVAGMMMEHAAVLTDSHVADVGVDAEQIPVPGGQHQKQGQMVSDGRSEHTRLLSSKPSSAYAPRLDRRAPRGLSGTVYSLRILPLRAENALRQ